MKLKFPGRKQSIIGALLAVAPFVSNCHVLQGPGRACAARVNTRQQPVRRCVRRSYRAS